MRISCEDIENTCPESDIYNLLLEMDDKHIVELGCGNAEHTRLIATSGHNRVVTAFEVDEVAHAKNLAAEGLPNLTFGMAGAQDIPLADNSADIVLMFKSLHHVPLDLLDQTLLEIKRILKPGGLAYISEPVFAGDFNEILRLFHDEEVVRKAAFEAVERAVEQGTFELAKEVFFNSPRVFADFAEYESQTLNVSHSDHQLDDELFAEVKRRFEAQCTPEGASFVMPIRVHLLKA